MTVRTVGWMLAAYGLTLLALYEATGTPFTLTGIIIQILVVTGCYFASRRVEATPTKRGYIDEDGHYREEELEGKDRS